MLFEIYLLLREWKDKPNTKRKYLHITYMIKGLYPEYIEDSQNSTIRKHTTQLEKGQKTWTDTSPKKFCGWQTSTWKDVYPFIRP